MSRNKNKTRIKILEATWHLMEDRCGQGVSMSEIAKTTGISRQAVYLHFNSRIELMIATVQYIDEVKGLDARFAKLESAANGAELLRLCIEVWGNYIPEIYGIAKALLNTRDTDQAAATAWTGCMHCLFEVCKNVIETLEKEKTLSSNWKALDAPEMLMTLLSIHNWEQLTIEYGWSQEKYIGETTNIALSSFLTTK